MKNEIFNILKEIRPDCDFEAEDNFVTAGFLDSLDVVCLVVELEEKFNIEIDGLDVNTHNFSSIDSITNLIKKYK